MKKGNRERRQALELDLKDAEFELRVINFTRESLPFTQYRTLRDLSRREQEAMEAKKQIMMLLDNLDKEGENGEE